MAIISVIMPVYNSSKYLERALKSILTQTFKDFEIILVDDGSTDNSGRICDDYVKSYPQCIRVLHTANQGPSAARNLGIRNADGDFLFFCDSDDYINPNTLETMYRLRQDHQVDFVVGDFRRINPYGNIDIALWNTNNIYLNKEAVKKVIVDFFLDQVKNTVYRTVWGKLFSANLLKKKNISFREDIHCYEDTLFCLEYMTNVNSLYYVSETLYTLCHNQDNIASSSVCNEPFAYQYMLSAIYEYLVRVGENSIDIKKEFANNYVKYAIRSIYNIIRLIPIYKLGLLYTKINNIVNDEELQEYIGDYYKLDKSDVKNMKQYLSEKNTLRIILIFKKKIYLNRFRRFINA